jgi:hypothetical protein
VTYLQDDMSLSKDASSTSAGFVLIWNVEPGDWVLTLNRPGMVCKPDNGAALPGPEPDLLRLSWFCEATPCLR